MDREPHIVINGHELTEGQAMTLRVAMEVYAIDLSDPKIAKRLGELGKHYQDRIAEIRTYMGYGPSSNSAEAFLEAVRRRRK